MERNKRNHLQIKIKKDIHVAIFVSKQYLNFLDDISIQLLSNHGLCYRCGVFTLQYKGVIWCI